MLVGVAWIAGAEPADDVLPGHGAGIRLPVEYFEDGAVKMVFTAEAARVPDGTGETEMTGAQAEIYDRSGVVQTRVQAERCFVDVKARRARSDDRVRLERPGMVVTGKGMELDTGAGTVHLLSDVRVELEHRPGKGLGALLPGRRKGRTRSGK